MNALQPIFDIFKNFVLGINEVWEWLTTPFWEDIAPIAIFGVAGLTAILAVLVVHFLNPVN